MALLFSVSIYSSCCYAAGIAGNIFALFLFVSPIPTFRRIMRNKSTEQFSGLPYVYALLNCLICFWYGLPVVSPGIILVATVNSIGAVFQLLYTIIFITYASGFERVKVSGLLVTVFALFVALVTVSIRVLAPESRRELVGYLSMISLISMFASPLSIIGLVIRTRSVEFMPRNLSLSTFLMSFSFFVYGMLEHDLFIYIPNGTGSVLGVVQLALYWYYSEVSTADSREPLIRI